MRLCVCACVRVCVCSCVRVFIVVAAFCFLSPPGRSCCLLRICDARGTCTVKGPDRPRASWGAIWPPLMAFRRLPCLCLPQPIGSVYWHEAFAWQEEKGLTFIKVSSPGPIHIVCRQAILRSRAADEIGGFAEPRKESQDVLYPVQAPSPARGGCW